MRIATDGLSNYTITRTKKPHDTLT
jgi:hypothetical protein